MNTTKVVHAALGAVLAAGLAQAQALPDAYSFTAKSEMVWPKSTHKVNRSGSKVLVEIVNEAGDFHTVQLYDLAAHKVYSRDLNAKTCTIQGYVSPQAPGPHDPIGNSEQMRLAMAKDPPKVLRTESVNGIVAKVVDASLGPQGKYTYWLDDKYGFPLKQTLTLTGKPERVLLEMQQVSYAPPAASLFAPPAGCTQTGDVTSATGGSASTSVKATVSGTKQLGKPAPKKK